MKHTKEPWRVDHFNQKGLGWAPDNPIVLIEAGPKEKPQPIANCLATHGPQERGMADAARIVACVNACADLPEPEKDIRELVEAAREAIAVYENSAGTIGLGNAKERAIKALAPFVEKRPAFPADDESMKGPYKP